MYIVLSLFIFLTLFYIVKRSVTGFDVGRLINLAYYYFYYPKFTLDQDLLFLFIGIYVSYRIHPFNVVLNQAIVLLT